MILPGEMTPSALLQHRANAPGDQEDVEVSPPGALEAGDVNPGGAHAGSSVIPRCPLYTSRSGDPIADDDDGMMVAWRLSVQPQ